MARKSKEENPRWVDNRKLHEHFLIYNKKKRDALAQGLPVPPITDNFIGECIVKITTGMSYNYRFRNYYSNWKEEMISDGIEAALKYSVSYDPFRKDKDGNDVQPNPHAYISMIVFNAFIQRIKKEQTEEYVKKQSFVNFNGFAADSDEDMSVFENDYGSTAGEFYEAFVSEVVEFQKKIEERKEKYYKKHEVKEKIMSVGKYFDFELE